MKIKDTKKIYILSFIILMIIICIIIIISNNNLKNSNKDFNSDNLVNDNKISNTFINYTEEFSQIENNNSLNNNSIKTTNINTNITQTSNLIGGRANTDNLYINDKPASLNPILTSKYSLGYLLKYEINENIPISEYKINIDDYITNNKPKGTGIWIADSDLQGLKGSKSSRNIILDILKEFGLIYSIDSNGFLERNNSFVEIATNINKIIESDKLVVIGFSPVYYTYFDNIDNKVGGCDLDNTFVSFEPIENIYPYIIREGCDTDELQEIINQILLDIN